jgi:hypothetical protein
MARRFSILLLLCATAVATGPARAANTDRSPGPVVVAHIDSGVHVTHREFDYRGPASADDQIVAWWDFTDHTEPALPGAETWDSRNPDPYDDNGHGTGTASLAVGRNVGPVAKQTRSFAPGAKLAVAKVTDPTGKGNANDISAAIDWATDVVHADVVTLSIATLLPLPGAVDIAGAAIRHAREAGVMVVVANGNGFADAGGPDPGWAAPYGDSIAALSVGATSPWGYTINTDPEVVAAYSAVPMASAACDACYRTNTGTSFGTPLVAGLAAAAMQAALDHGAPADPGRIETLVKYGARDTETPPQFEGYGVIDAAQVPAILAHAADGTLPVRPDLDANALYVDQGAGTMRDLWSFRSSGGFLFAPTSVAPVNGPGVLGPSAVSGLVEVERYIVRVSAKVPVVATARPGPAGWLGIRMYAGAGPAYDSTQLLASDKAAGAGDDVSARFRPMTDGVVSILVLEPFFAIGDTPYTLRVDGVDAAPFSDEHFYATNSTVDG